MYAEIPEVLICLWRLTIDWMLGSSKENDCFGCEMNDLHEPFFLAVMSELGLLSIHTIAI
jgi:hypothetical protein